MVLAIFGMVLVICGFISFDSIFWRKWLFGTAAVLFAITSLTTSDYQTTAFFGAGVGVSVALIYWEQLVYKFGVGIRALTLPIKKRYDKPF